jgi:hypothetical protein
MEDFKRKRSRTTMIYLFNMALIGRFLGPVMPTTGSAVLPGAY